MTAVRPGGLRYDSCQTWRANIWQLPELKGYDKIAARHRGFSNLILGRPFIFANKTSTWQYFHWMIKNGIFKSYNFPFYNFDVGDCLQAVLVIKTKIWKFWKNKPLGDHKTIQETYFLLRKLLWKLIIKDNWRGGIISFFLHHFISIICPIWDWKVN